jgi:hypothetical protein
MERIQMNIWKTEMDEMPEQQISDELEKSLKSVEYFDQLLELAESGDVVDEHVVDILRHKKLYWFLRKNAFHNVNSERTSAANTSSGVAAEV